MSVQARKSNPAILNLRDSKLGIQFMNHADPRLQHEITHLFHFSMDWKSWTVNARSHCKNGGFFYLVMLSGATHFTQILWIERRLGAGVWGNGLEEENGGNVQLHLSEIISSCMWPHFLESVQPTDITCGLFFLSLISVVKLYSTEVLVVSGSPRLTCCCVLLSGYIKSSDSRWVEIKIRTDNWNLTR